MAEIIVELVSNQSGKPTHRVGIRNTGEIQLFRIMDDGEEKQLPPESLENFNKRNRVGNIELLKNPEAWAEFADSNDSRFSHFVTHIDGIELNQFRNQELRYSYLHSIQQEIADREIQKTFSIFSDEDLALMTTMMLGEPVSQELHLPLSSNRVVQEILEF